MRTRLFRFAARYDESGGTSSTRANDRLLFFYNSRAQSSPRSEPGTGARLRIACLRTCIRPSRVYVSRVYVSRSRQSLSSVRRSMASSSQSREDVGRGVGGVFAIVPRPLERGRAPIPPSIAVPPVQRERFGHRRRAEHGAKEQPRLGDRLPALLAQSHANLASLVPVLIRLHGELESRVERRSRRDDLSPPRGSRPSPRPPRRPPPRERSVAPHDRWIRKTRRGR